MFKDVLITIVVMVVVGGYFWFVWSVIKFVVETPKQLKRIADALKKEQKDGK